MSQITVVGSFHLAEGKMAEGRAAFLQLAADSLHEDGCLSYVFHADVNDERSIVGIEQWASQDALNAHMQQPYVAALVEQAPTLLDQPFSLQVVSPI